MTIAVHRIDEGLYLNIDYIEGIILHEKIIIRTYSGDTYTIPNNEKSIQHLKFIGVTFIDEEN